ncbi:MAG TPA: elongation factor P [Moorella mulderi]|nr:elongation factor P [Moorella mulderi]
MISTNDFFTGVTIEVDGEVYQVIEFLHFKTAQRQALVRTKLRNLRTGAVLERTFKAGEKVKRVYLDKREAQYLYRDGDTYYFMDNETYEQFALSGEQLGEGAKFLKENMNLQVLFYGDQILGVELPVTVELKVVQTEPGIRGDMVSGGSKPAVLETGAVIQVPLFVEVGDVVKVDTREGTYVERV